MVFVYRLSLTNTLSYVKAFPSALISASAQFSSKKGVPFTSAKGLGSRCVLNTSCKRVGGGAGPGTCADAAQVPMINTKSKAYLNFIVANVRGAVRKLLCYI